MIEQYIRKYIKDANYRLSKIQKLNTEEEDIILLLRDLSGIIEIITNLRNKLAKNLDKYIIKN